MQTIELKIAYIGGGSREWARKLMFDLALCPELTGQVALYDIDMDSARLNEQLGNWLQGQPDVVSRWRYAVVPTLEEALRGADFVVASIQPGTLEVMAQEIAIAEQYGLFFPVGDTTGAPGLVRGLRSATIYAGFAHAIAAICPNAWVINYTNPMTICARTLTRVEPQLKVLGCCHEVFGTQWMLALLVSQHLGVSPAPSRDEIKVNVLGINHFTWIDQACYRDVDLLELVRRHIAQPGVIRHYAREEVESWNDWFRSAEQVKFALLQHYGLLAAAGDRHLVEFLPGFIRSPEELFRWGVIRTPVSWRIERWRNAPQKTRDLMAGREPLSLHTSGEEGVAQIKALVGLGDVITNVNMENQGQIANLALCAVVETNACFSRDEVRPIVAGVLPSGLQSLIARHVSNQEMIIEAALRCDTELAFQAVFNDPANHLALDAAWEMFNLMLQASREFLPGWRIN
jgi:alpha-galactosidase/6-phospho-beta-glucosidase family protein